MQNIQLPDAYAQFWGIPEKEDFKRCFRLGSLEIDIEKELHKIYWVMQVALEKYIYRSEEIRIGLPMRLHLRPQPIL